MTSFLEDIPFVEEVLKNTDKKAKDGRNALEVYKEYYSALAKDISKVCKQINEDIVEPTTLKGKGFSIDDFVQEFGLTIKEEFSAKFSGKIEDKIITLNENDNPQRRNFTLAHELGHFFIHIKEDDNKRIDYRGLPDYTPQQKIEEAEADCFAGELLMPNDLVIYLHNTLKNMHNSEPSELIYILANIFNVSKLAMTNKFRKLKIIKPWTWVDLYV